MTCQIWASQKMFGPICFVWDLVNCDLMMIVIMMATELTKTCFLPNDWLEGTILPQVNDSFAKMTVKVEAKTEKSYCLTENSKKIF